MSNDRKRKPFGQRLIASLEQGLEALRSGRELPSTTVIIPPDPAPFKSEYLVTLRKRYQMTQPVLAALLNVSDKAVESWEQGKRNPNGAALRLLQMLDKPSIFETIFAPGRRGKRVAQSCVKKRVKKVAACAKVRKSDRLKAGKKKAVGIAAK